MTPRQQLVLKTIVAMLRKNGTYPTYRELGERLGITSPHGVQRHLKALRDKGHLEPGRKIRLVIGKVCPCCGREMP